MANALTLEDMSPGLRKVVDRAKCEPEGRFHSLAYLIDIPALERAYHRQRFGIVSNELYEKRCELTIRRL